MFRHTKKRRSSDAVNAGSMADIAFLLLIFFLVTTTILNDKGILVKLPPFSNDPPTQIGDRNVLKIHLNAWDDLLVEGEKTTVPKIREKVKTFILNPEQLPTLAEKPSKAVVSLQHDRATHYEAYIAVYNELRAAYNELWDERARRLYGKSYEELPPAFQAEVRKELPLLISEAEPTGHREE